MPQLNVAPSPSPVVAPPTPANAATPADASPPGTAGDAQTQPFAAVLHHQVSQQANASSKGTADKNATDKNAAAVLTMASEIDGNPADQPPPDAITALAQMLPGIVPPAATKRDAEDPLPAEADERAKRAAAPDDGAQPVMLAAPVLPAMPVAVPAGPKAPSEEQAPVASDTAKPILVASQAANQAEYLAADAGKAANGAASGKQETTDFASLLATPQATAAQTQHTVPAAAASHSVETPVGTRGWDNEVGQKLTWMVNKHESRAELVLNPPELGRIEVSITMKGDQASATFVSANPTVRDAIESAVPRLREVLQDAGISLGQTQVGAESFQQQQSAGKRENGDNSWRGGNVGATGADATLNGVAGGNAAPTMRRGNGMVDTFA
jgi:flagellar hook-length control protein FliK